MKVFITWLFILGMFAGMLIMTGIVALCDMHNRSLSRSMLDEMEAEMCDTENEELYDFLHRIIKKYGKIH